MSINFCRLLRLLLRAGAGPQSQLSGDCKLAGCRLSKRTRGVRVTQVVIQIYTQRTNRLLDNFTYLEAVGTQTKEAPDQSLRSLAYKEELMRGRGILIITILGWALAIALALVIVNRGGFGAAPQASLDVPYDKLDKVFIGHLHLDHGGDLPSFYFTRAVNQGRARLRVWGPSGVKPEWGMKAAMENMKAMYGWESAMRGALMGTPELEVNEFDWTGINQIIYNENSVIVRSIPALHGDQSVSFILEWNRLRVAYSSDTMPNKWWCEHTKGADVAIHEAFYPKATPLPS